MKAHMFDSVAVGYEVNGPFRPEILPFHDSQAFGLGCKNEPFRLKY